MPNWGYLAINFLYHLGLALWIGGAVVLGALVAPALFRALPRSDAGNIFGPTLRRFSRLRVVAIGLVVIGAAVKYAVWGRHAKSPWIAIRWAASGDGERAREARQRRLEQNPSRDGNA